MFRLEIIDRVRFGMITIELVMKVTSSQQTSATIGGPGFHNDQKVLKNYLHAINTYVCDVLEFLLIRINLPFWLVSN